MSFQGLEKQSFQHFHQFDGEDCVVQSKVPEQVLNGPSRLIRANS